MLWLVTRHGLDPAEVTDALEHRSGLLGLAGTADMAEVVGRVERGDEAAGARPRRSTSTGCGRAICAMAASLGGLDVLVFTGGVGENAPVVRAAAAGGAAVPRRGDRPGGQRRGGPARGDPPGVRDVTAPGAAARVLVVAAREDLEIARGVRALLT